MNLYEIYKSSKEKKNKHFNISINILEDIFPIGFEANRLITITGEEEVGKTKLLNQIIFDISKTNKCLYFSLEFNKNQLKKDFEPYVENYGSRRLKNIDVITLEEIEGSIIEVEEKILEHKAELIFIDSALMLFDEDKTGENEITYIFKKLYDITIKNNKTIFIIAQNSKEDLKNNRISIFGSQKANHFASIMIHLKKEKNNNLLIIHKNKQNGIKKQVKFLINNDLELCKIGNSKDLELEKENFIKQKDKIEDQFEKVFPKEVSKIKIILQDDIEDHSALKEVEEKAKQKGVRFED